MVESAKRKDIIMVTGNENKLLQQMVEQQKLFTYLYDLRSQKIVLASNSLESFLGFDPVTRGISLLDFAKRIYHPDDRKLMKHKIEYFKKNNGGVWAGVLRIKHKDGPYIWIYVRHSVLDQDTEGIPALIGVVAFEIADSLETPFQVKELTRELLNNDDFKQFKTLTQREISIIRLISQGMDHINIAMTLSISRHTVDTHRKNILRKLGLHNIAALSSYAGRMGLT